MLGQRLDRHHAVRSVHAACNLLDGAHGNSALVGDPLPLGGSVFLKSADDKFMHRFGHNADSSPFLGTLQPDLGEAKSIRYWDMSKRRSKAERPPTLIRNYVADNVATLRDLKYTSDKYKSVAAKNKQLATDSGLSKNQVYRILDKSQGTSIDNLEWLAETFGVRPQDLVTPYFARGSSVTPITTKRRKTQPAT